MITLEYTPKQKAKRVIKYLLVIIAVVVLNGIVNAVIDHFYTEPWLDFKYDWKIVYGAMVYRLVSTWNPKEI